MRKIKYLICLLVAIVLSSCSDTRIKFGTAGIGGNYYIFGQTYTHLVAEDHNEFKFEVKQTSGSDANLRLMADGYLQMTIAQMDAIASSNASGCKAIAALYTEYVQIAVMDSSIHSIQDLKGKTVSIGESESGTSRNASHILQVYGLPYSLVQTVNMSYTEAAAALRAGEIDAMFVTAGVQTDVIESLAKDGVSLLSIDATTMGNLTEAYPFYTKSVIPAGTYTGQKEDITTIGIPAILLASDKLSTENVYQLTKSLFDHADDLKAAVVPIQELSEESAIQNVNIDFHPGALKYYQEKGIQ